MFFRFKISLIDSYNMSSGGFRIESPMDDVNDIDDKNIKESNARNIDGRQFTKDSQKRGR